MIPRRQPGSVLTLRIVSVAVAAAVVFAGDGTRPPVRASGQAQGTSATSVPAPDPTVSALVGRLSLERYKATIKGLARFGDRREGTQRNRDAVDWIEAQLKSYGCETARHRYELPPPAAGRGRGGGAGRGRGTATSEPPRVPAGTPDDPVRRGARNRGYGAPTGANNDPERQPDVTLRELNRGPVLPGPRDQVYCTKVGAAMPSEMFIVSAHMDGIGYGEAANDDGSGTALVMELARILNAPDVASDRSIRFVLWNSEELGERGSQAYVADRRALQGREDPAGSGRYPEPRWLGVIQHDMLMFDHGMPAPDGQVSPWQRAEADINIEFQVNSKLAAESQKLAWLVKDANHLYATDYPAVVGQHMQNTDSAAFMHDAPAVSLRENERRDQIGFGWSPHWHRPTDVVATYSDKDFRLGLNAAQTTLAAVAGLAGVRLR
jgi:hypothetical protein